MEPDQLGKGFEGYGLRENPKKSRKFSHLKLNETRSTQERVKCQVCDREFESPRALHGHLRHHSKKERKQFHCKECGKKFVSLRSLTIHMRLHSETLRLSDESGSGSRLNLGTMTLSDGGSLKLVRGKRSNRMRYKISPNSSSFSSLNDSVSGLEIEPDVEEGAICLMLLSRNVRRCIGFDFFGESMETDCVPYEAKSLCGKRKIGRSVDSDGNEVVQMKRRKKEKLGSCGSDSKNEISGCCDCEGEAGLEVQVERFDQKKTKTDDESGVELFDSELEKKIDCQINSDPVETESRENFMDYVGLDLAGLESAKFVPINKDKFEACAAGSGRDSGKKVICSTSDSNVRDDSLEQRICKFRICNKKFPTNQSLGGHNAGHGKVKSCVALKTQEDIRPNFSPEIAATSKIFKLETIQYSVEQKTGGVAKSRYESKKSKEHKCVICFKSFVSGQALGGHKRAHLAKAREEQEETKAREEQEETMALKRDAPDACDMIDISLPCMVDVEVSNDIGFKPWWTGSDRKHGPFVGLVTN